MKFKTITPPLYKPGPKDEAGKEREYKDKRKMSNIKAVYFESNYLRGKV